MVSLINLQSQNSGNFALPACSVAVPKTAGAGRNRGISGAYAARAGQRGGGPPIRCIKWGIAVEKSSHLKVVA
jgi:hypothetical protein